MAAAPGSIGLNLTGPALVLLDRAGTIMAMNAAARAVMPALGVPETATRMGDGGPPVVREVLRRVLGGEVDTAGTEYEINGAAVEVRVISFAPASSAAVLLIRDVSFEDKLQQRCVQLEKFEGMDRLIASVVHDVRNPLTAASALIQTTQLCANLAEDQDNRLSDAVKNIERAAELLSNLVRFTRDESPTFHPYSLNRIVEETIQLQRSNFQSRHVTITSELDPDTPQVFADPGQLRQVLVNLMSNAADAIEATGQPGDIHVATSARLGIVRVSVEDDGPGIPPEVAPHIFAPFFTTKAPGKGTGLGLAISHGIAKSHGGHLWFRPRRPHGARFVLDLPDPRSMMPAKEKSFMGVSRSSHPAAAALVVESDPRQLEVASQTLRRSRFTVHVAATGAAALSKLRATSFQLVLISCDLDDMSGDELLRQALKLDGTFARRVLLTASQPDDPAVRRLVAQLAVPCLEKPFGAQELSELLESQTAPSLA